MASTRGRQVVIPVTNKSGGALAAGDVVIVDTANNEAVTTTTTGRAEVSVGVAQEAIANNAIGRVLIAGYAALVNVPSSVTRGHYIETHTVAKQAAGNSTRRSGSFGQFLTGGTTPTAVLWGQTDQTASGGSTFVGCRVYASGTQAITTATFTAVLFDTEEYDTDALHDTGSNTGRLTASATGKWNVTAGVTWDTNTTNNRYLLMRVNGTTYVRGTIRQDVGSSGRASQNISSGPIALSATDYVEVLVYQDSGGNRNIGDASDLYYQSTASFWKAG